MDRILQFNQVAVDQLQDSEGKILNLYSNQAQGSSNINAQILRKFRDKKDDQSQDLWIFQEVSKK